MKTSRIFLIALGANLPSPAGPPEETLTAALARLGADDLCVERVSRYFRTPCFPPGAGPDYVNAATVVRGTETAPGMLDRLHALEARFGRERGQRWGRRTLDLDLLAAGDTVLPDARAQAAWRGLRPEQAVRHVPDRLILPHPRLQERAFVLVPLAEVAPDWMHPLLGQSVAQMLADLSPEAVAEARPL